MPSVSTCFEAKTPHALYPISSETKQRLDTLAPERNIATLEEATNIIKSLLKESNLSDTHERIVFHVLHLHLRFLVFKSQKSPLTAVFRKYQNTSIQEICASLYKVVEKFTSLKRKFKQVWDFLRLRNINRLIKENTRYGRIQENLPPPTLRRGPLRKSRYFSYA